ncbi:hypothetical protein [Mumia zhuanghuii]|uniref:Uncharacterized protein n=1 Tax=Mumia zhuanghuii TaxID=2585211 RepID=A0A5C4MDN0_9ACTN|nr:hypothetical protein [Mumia zhuanghuii]TNC33512.1 hypothetical protein FHE65_28905 [Mumia zhuanghuii]
MFPFFEDRWFAEQLPFCAQWEAFFSDFRPFVADAQQMRPSSCQASRACCHQQAQQFATAVGTAAATLVDLGP